LAINNVVTLAVNFLGVLVESKQLNLFEENSRTLFPRRDELVMNMDALIRWKQRIFDYQHSVRNSKPPQQQTLTSPSPLELLVTQAVTDSARSLGVLASRVEAFEAQLSQSQQERNLALDQQFRQRSK
jgi:hypothetical protein